MWQFLKYYWITTRGYRLNPWNSPYIRWRFETFLGTDAAGLTAAKFLQLSWKYREKMEEFVQWCAERQRSQRARSKYS